MTPELENKLYQRFPNLFVDRSLPMTQTCMCWGIETGDGWFKILWDLCEKLEKFKGLRFVQVKEKFGGLRVYYNFESEHRTIKSYRLFLRGLNSRTKRKIKREYKTIDYLIDEAEKVAWKTCEYCGSELELEKDGEGYWIAKSCRKCKVK